MLLVELAELAGVVEVEVHAASASVAKTHASQRDGFRDGGITLSSSEFI
jgi:hypothetical protein